MLTPQQKHNLEFKNLQKFKEVAGSWLIATGDEMFAQFLFANGALSETEFLEWSQLARENKPPKFPDEC